MKMDYLFDFFNHINTEKRIKKTRLNQYFLEDIADILSLRGFDEAKLFVWDNINKGNRSEQINNLLIVLNVMESISELRKDLKLCSYIIRNKLDRIE